MLVVFKLVCDDPDDTINFFLGNNLNNFVHLCTSSNTGGLDVTAKRLFSEKCKRRGRHKRRNMVG